jgi:hypothetical protein
VLVDKYLRLGAQGQVCDQDVAPIIYQQLREGEVDTYLIVSILPGFRPSIQCDIPEPAPVTIAVRPLTGRAIVYVIKGKEVRGTTLRTFQSFMSTCGTSDSIAARTVAVLEKRGTPRREAPREGLEPVLSVGK